MCVIAIGWRAFADAPVVIWSNRDELVSRPTAPLARWSEQPEIVAGRDLREGGTWLGVQNNGRFAAITNFRDPSERVEGARSRGALPVAFLQSAKSPLEFMESIRSARSQYRGFLLLAGDDHSALVYESRLDVLTPLPPGVTAFSNGPLAVPWPKSVRLGNAMRAQAPHTPALDHAFAALSDYVFAPESELPDTGVAPEVETALSSVFIPPSGVFSAPYQTRASTVIVRDGTGWQIVERTYLQNSQSEYFDTTISSPRPS
jgi:uncharacterized protein with NRDE domain